MLDLWIAQIEGAKFWLSVMNELKNRGVEDIFIACVDGLKGFPDAIEAVYPKTQVQLCIVHQIASASSAGKSVKPLQQTLNHLWRSHFAASRTGPGVICRDVG